MEHLFLLEGYLMNTIQHIADALVHLLFYLNGVRS